MKKQEIKPGQGERLKRCLEYAGVSQKSLALETFVSQQTISKIINEKAPLSRDNAVLFSRALNVRLEYLLLEDNYMTENEIISMYYQLVFDRSSKCESIVEALGYKVITMQENADGTSESMHREYKTINILEEDTPETIMDKARSAPNVRVYKVISPDGRIAFIEQSAYNEMIRDIEDYAKFVCEKLFCKLERSENIVKNGY